ncbi:MAG: 16S rRNA (guanine(527)-N(7))-methyltransferase RsmG [Synergistaceae bacterium]|jgi:16S rRNA (guanine527-N7)-methyltransferase|nr:16S rRNA (guanine(527)-N(7))-methyltransferase RsmG [Synergistaceae bacterium]
MDMNIGRDISERLMRYAELLGAANARARLTGPSDPAAIRDDLIADALAALPLLEVLGPGGSFIDVGTGGGLPGLVWSICRPDMSGVLLDSVKKKTDLLREIAESLGVRNVRVVNARSEDFAATARESFDVATARAVARSDVLCEYLSPFVKAGGRIIAFKGAGVEGELDTPPDMWKEMGLGKPDTAAYTTASGGERRLVVWVKVAVCPTSYPRKPGEAKKNPWTGLNRAKQGKTNLRKR